MANAMEIKVSGIDKVVKNLAATGEQIIQAVARALYEDGNALKLDAQAITPVDIGTLRSSGYVTLPEITGNEIKVVVGFGGAARAYAEIVHERLDVYHKPPTQAKYLETPFNARAKGFDQRIGKAVADILK
jgi:hypothetical protein